MPSVRFEAFTVVKIHIMVLWVVMPCSVAVIALAAGSICSNFLLASNTSHPCPLWAYIHATFTSPWRRRQCGPLKHCYPTTALHSITTQKTLPWIHLNASICIEANISYKLIIISVQFFFFTNKDFYLFKVICCALKVYTLFVNTHTKRGLQVYLGSTIIPNFTYLHQVLLPNWEVNTGYVKVRSSGLWCCVVLQ